MVTIGIIHPLPRESAVMADYQGTAGTEEPGGNGPWSRREVLKPANSMRIRGQSATEDAPFIVHRGLAADNSRHPPDSATSFPYTSTGVQAVRTKTEDPK